MSHKKWLGNQAGHSIESRLACFSDVQSSHVTPYQESNDSQTFSALQRIKYTCSYEDVEDDREQPLHSELSCRRENSKELSLRQTLAFGIASILICIDCQWRSLGIEAESLITNKNDGPWCLDGLCKRQCAWCQGPDLLMRGTTCVRRILDRKSCEPLGHIASGLM